MGFWEDNRCKVIFTFLFGVADITATTVLYGHYNDYMKHFTEDMHDYKFSRSMLELWIFSIARLSLTMGFLLGILCNRTIESVERINKFHYFPLLLATLMWTFSVVKMLAYSEGEDSMKRPWFWSLFGWTMFCNIMLYVNTCVLGAVNVPPSRLPVTLSRNCSINATDSEAQPLLGSGGSSTAEDNDKEEKKEIPIEKKASNVFRLIKYSKPDWLYILIAFVFMNISTVGMYILLILDTSVRNTMCS